MISTIRQPLSTPRIPRTMYHSTGYLIITLAILLLTSYTGCTRDGKLYLGAILPRNDIYAFSIRKLRPVFDVAIETVERELLPGYHLQVEYGNSGADIALAPHWAHLLHQRLNISGLIGPVSDYGLAPVARQAHLWRMPVITVGGMGEHLHDPKYFSTLVRFGFYHIDDVILRFMEVNGWTRVKLLYTEQSEHNIGMSSSCYQLPKALREAVDEHKHDFYISTSVISANYGKMLITEVGSEFAIVVLCAPADVVRPILARAQELDFNNGHYVFIVLDLFRAKHETTRPWYRDRDARDANDFAMKSYKFVINIAVNRPSRTQNHNVSLRIKQRAAELYKDTTFYDNPNPYLGVFYDAVIVFARAVNDTIGEGRNIWEDGVIVSHILSLQKYTGVTGSISFGERGNRYTEYAILDMVNKRDGESLGQFHVVAKYYSDSDSYVTVADRRIHWGEKREFETPPDIPICSYNQNCGIYIHLEMVLISISVIFVVGVVFFYCLYIRCKSTAELSDLKWRIKWENVQLDKPDESVLGLTNHTSETSEESEKTGSDYSGVIEKGFTDVRSVNGIRVSVKFLQRRSFTIDKAALIELKRMMNIENDHICRFIGACIDQPYQSIMTEYCGKGSLRDLLDNVNFTIDWMFQFSLMQDMAKGMAFIHSSDFRSHGDLTTMNCVVDVRFVLKITDFGLHFLRDDVRRVQYQRKLWTAPELMRMSYKPIIGTQKGDVYSFAIVCQEIVYRKGVFYVEAQRYLSSKKKYENIKQGLQPYFRPTLESTDPSHKICFDILSQSWSEDPDQRPSFNDILHSLSKLNKSTNTCNLLDNLLTRMETYANDLESLVEERSKGIKEEKQQADALLHLLLPRTVAEKLINGEVVPPESYDSVTIFLSDVVGFTALSASCTPMDTVDMLNDLYTLFDCISDTFDVYKVETIGDAYMVVSGLPVRNGIKHAAEIAGMALAIHCAVKTFQIGFRPETQLRLRIGLHTGPVCTGVIGSKMPRYCLFGRTVTEAVSYESWGMPEKIHISEQTMLLLDEIGGFDIETRGDIHIATLGTVTSYWLLSGTYVRTSSPPMFRPRSFRDSLRKRRKSTIPIIVDDMHSPTISSQTTDSQPSLSDDDKRFQSIQTMIHTSGVLSHSVSDTSGVSQNLLSNIVRDSYATTDCTLSSMFSIAYASDDKDTVIETDSSYHKQDQITVPFAKPKQRKLARFRNSIQEQSYPLHDFLESPSFEFKRPLPKGLKRLSIADNALSPTSSRGGRRSSAAQPFFTQKRMSIADNALSPTSNRSRRRSSVAPPFFTQKHKNSQVAPQTRPRPRLSELVRAMVNKRQKTLSRTNEQKETWASRELQERRECRRVSTTLQDIKDSAKPSVPSHVYQPLFAVHPKPSPIYLEIPKSPQGKTSVVHPDYTKFPIAPKDPRRNLFP